MSLYERHDWLAGRSESAIDSDRPIVDPHHHLWDRGDSRYLAAELRADATAGHNIIRTVFVECSAEYATDDGPELAPVGETRFVAAQASHVQELGGPEIAAIVGHVDMTLGAQVVPVLQAHVDAGAGLFRGIRHGTNWSPFGDVKDGHHRPSKGLMGTPQFRAGIEALASLELSFDAWLYFDQLAELAELAAAVPHCTIIVDHLGGPLGIGPHAAARAAMAQVWRDGIAQVSAHENVVLKVGGLGMEHYFGTPWASSHAPPSSEEVAVYWNDMVHFAIDSFGPERCMFESNFPVDRQTLPYTVLWNAFQILADRYSESEQDDLFVGTATRTYRLEAIGD